MCRHTSRVVGNLPGQLRDPHTCFMLCMGGASLPNACVAGADTRIASLPVRSYTQAPWKHENSWLRSKCEQPIASTDASLPQRPGVNG